MFVTTAGPVRICFCLNQNWFYFVIWSLFHVKLEPFLLGLATESKSYNLRKFISISEVHLVRICLQYLKK